MKIVLWDIENIGYVYMKKEIQKFNSFEKLIVHNKKQIPMKENQKNQLKNLKWNFKEVNPGKDSSDHALIDHIHNNIKKFNEFHIITGDKGFSSTISMLLSLNKKVYLYLKEEYTENLINSIYKKTKTEYLENFKIIYL